MRAVGPATALRAPGTTGRPPPSQVGRMMTGVSAPTWRKPCTKLAVRTMQSIISYRLAAVSFVHCSVFKPGTSTLQGRWHAQEGVVKYPRVCIVRQYTHTPWNRARCLQSKSLFRGYVYNGYTRILSFSAHFFSFMGPITYYPSRQRSFAPSSTFDDDCPNYIASGEQQYSSGSHLVNGDVVIVLWSLA